MTVPRERVLKAGDGTQLFATDFVVGASHDGKQSEAASAPFAGGIVIMHGLGEHCGRYLHVARFLNALGWSVRTYDHRGHGRSGGPRGDTPDTDTLLQDAKLVIDDFARRLPQPPVLLGHSMGGLFAARFAVAGLSPLRGLILSSPALAIPLSEIEKFSLKILGALAPGFGMSNGLKLRYLSHDQAVVDAYKLDPLVHSKISARLLHSMLAAVDFVHAHAEQLQVPALLLVAGDDHLVNADGSKQFFARLPSGIGTLHWYDGFYHELFNETDAQRVLGDMKVWLAAL